LADFLWLWWSGVFAGVFREIGCANVVFLRGKRGEVVVICVAKSDSNWPTKNGTPFLNFFWGTGRKP
jgi:hypothetical protein